MASFHHRIKSGKKGTAKEHTAYIERQGKYRDRDQVLYTSHGNLPDWAEEDPVKFWKAADHHERNNGAAYREHEIALPNELDKYQLCVLAEKMAKELVGNKPYQSAIHAPEGSLGGISNPHLHLMYSDRLPDGLKRSPEQTFKRFNAKHPELGGCRKDSGGKTRMQVRDDLIAVRKCIADLQNHTLMEHGSSARVDHRSLEAQGLVKKPERHLGPARIKRMSTDEKAEYIGLRLPGRDGCETPITACASPAIAATESPE